MNQSKLCILSAMIILIGNPFSRKKDVKYSIFPFQMMTMLNPQRKYCSEISRFKSWKDYSNPVVLKAQLKYLLGASQALPGVHKVKTGLIKTPRHYSPFLSVSVYNSMMCT